MQNNFQQAYIRNALRANMWADVAEFATDKSKQYISHAKMYKNALNTLNSNTSGTSGDNVTAPERTPQPEPQHQNGHKKIISRPPLKHDNSFSQKIRRIYQQQQQLNR